MTQPDRAICPALAGIWTTVSEKLHKGMQKRSLYRRTVPVVDTDDTAQSARLSIRVAGASNDKRNGPAVDVVPKKNGIPFRPGIHPEAEFSNNDIPILKCCLARALFYCQLSSRATARRLPLLSCNSDAL
jgi:hypothetical protein